MRIVSEIRQVEPERFQAYLDAISRALGFVSSDAIPDGISDVEAHQGVVSVAVSREIGFAAVRWFVVAEGVGAVVETFFVCPADRPAHSAVTVRHLGHRGENSAAWEAIMSEWPAAVQGEVAPANSALPDFTKLATILASKGEVVMGDRELWTRVSALESELTYMQIALYDRTMELETAKQNIRLMATVSAKPTSPATSVRPEGDGQQDSRAASTGQNGLEHLSTWSMDNHERIVVLPRALSGAKKSQYHEPAIIMATLEFLAGPYRDYRRGRFPIAEYQALLAKQDFQIANSVTPTVAGSFGDEYFVSWAGRRMLLDQHALKGGGREPRYCMRIYFFWDPVTERCIVGALPQHLTNSLS